MFKPKINELELRIRTSLSAHATGPLEGFRLSNSEVLDLLDSKEYNNFSSEFRCWLDHQMDLICEEQGQ